MAKRSASNEDPRPAKHRTTDTTSRKGFSGPESIVSLKVFVGNAFFGLLIQPNDDIFDETFNRVVSRDVSEIINDKHFGFASLKAFYKNQREQLRLRQLASASTIVMADSTSAENDAFAFGHTATITAVQDGENVEIKAVTVGQIVERVDGSEPQLRIERIVFEQT